MRSDSTARSQRLLDAALSGDRVGERRVREALIEAETATDRAEMLDAIAASAARGSTAGMELLVWAVDELRLAHPAIRRLLVNDADVDEVAQDVLVAVAETIGGFRNDARFTTWLYQVARYKAIGHLRRRRPTHALPDGEVLGDAKRISSMIANRVSVADIIGGLPDTYREPVVLRDVEQLAYDELARRLGLNVNTAKARVARGRALVAARLGER